MQNMTYFLFACLAMTALVQCKPVNHHRASRELATLVQKFPETSLGVLREIRQNVKRTQAGIRMIMVMERDLKKTVRLFTESMVDESKDTKVNHKVHSPIVKDDQNRKSAPFSSWAG